MADSGTRVSGHGRSSASAMKIFISTFAVILALAFTGPAFAGDVWAPHHGYSGWGP